MRVISGTYGDEKRVQIMPGIALSESASGYPGAPPTCRRRDVLSREDRQGNSAALTSSPSADLGG